MVPQARTESHSDFIFTGGFEFSGRQINVAKARFTGTNLNVTGVIILQPLAHNDTLKLQPCLLPV